MKCNWDVSSRVELNVECDTAARFHQKYTPSGLLLKVKHLQAE